MAAPRVDRHLFVVFGATGDLMRRKLLPSLYKVGASLGDPPPFRLLGVARRSLDDAGFRALCAGALVDSGAAPPAEAGRWAAANVQYASLGAGADADYGRLGRRVEEVESVAQLPGHRVFYLALPSDAIASVVQGLGAAGLSHGPGWTRVVVEKPFGTDLASARELNGELHREFDERSVYRIDHYLGKETVQNLIVFRFANMLFESVWNRDRISHVEITVAEDLGVEDRATYYDGAGALRDMVQSHLTQLLSLTAMEVPSSLEADAVRNEKVKVLESIEPLGPDDVVRGQYGPGRAGSASLPGYLAEAGVRPSSTTETFVAVRLRLNNWRWQGVPFFLRTGKRLPEKRTEIVVHFRRPPVWFFPGPAPAEISANTLTVTLQPHEGFELAFEIKRPGRAIELETHRLHFQYSEAFGPLEDAYQTLLVDLMRGDPTLFVRADEVEAAWRVYGPVLERPPPLHGYPAGSWGPEEAARLPAELGHAWSTD
ncbi:MAG TPA: glucose-6-phosphate dehydrogenase [Thermoplasmata archaeon]|nr:glucose-6-phosphate dehydrogenase [Thermoplasmata archaeon]